MRYWFDLFRYTYSPVLEFIAWPDGKPYLAQDNLMVELFSDIYEEVATMRSEETNG